MTADQWAYWGILVPSALVVGAAVYLAVRRVAWMWTDRDALQIGYVFLWSGIAGIVWLVANAVRQAPQHSIHPTITVWKYVAALCLCFVGMVMVIAYQHQHPIHRKETT